MYAECPDSDARDFLLENIIEEESGRKHVDLLIRFARGLRGEPHRGRDARSSCRRPAALTAWCYETARSAPSTSRRPGLLVGLESQVPGIYQRNLPPLKTHYGFTDHEVEFFAIHIEADEVHGERGYQIVERHADHAGKQDDAAEQVREATEMRWQYMTGPPPGVRPQGRCVSGQQVAAL